MLTNQTISEMVRIIRDKFESCLRCRNTYWLAESEEN